MDERMLEKQNPWWKTGKMELDFFDRRILKELQKNLKNEKILALLGSRQVGKTSLLYLLIQYLLKSTKPRNIFYFNLDDFGIKQMLSNASDFLDFIRPGKDRKFIFIDEMQRLETPGLFLKTIYDLHVNIKIVVSGSSQLELRSKLKEFLVGRLRQFEIPRLSLQEMSSLHPNRTKSSLIKNMMLFGSYPQVAKEDNYEEKKLFIRDIYETYLKKDISDFAKIENIDAFNKLLIILAAQIGGMLNIHMLSKTLRLSQNTLNKYLDILEGTFIIKRIFPFFKNYKKEITKMPKIYFLDLGLRNFLLTNWNPIDIRPDKGILFENFVFLELLNRDPYQQKRYRFWRTTNQTEIDFIVEEGQKNMAFEVKYANAKEPKSFKTFKKYYPSAQTKLITPETIEKIF